MSQRNIVLTGFMGTGKTTVGQLLAYKTGRKFVDTDDIIIEKTGRSIADIFSIDGEETFHQMEREVARNLAHHHNLVIVNGGRLMIDPLNSLLLSRNGIVICLSAEPEEILDRIRSDGLRRPLLAGPDPANRVSRLLKERWEAYNQFHQISTTGKTPDSVVNEIIQKISFWEKDLDSDVSIQSRIPVRYPGGSYQVIVGRDLLSNLDQSTDLRKPIAIVTDSNVGPLYSQKLANQKPLPVITLPAGERYKSLNSIQEIYDQLLAIGFDRRSTIIALGGGVVGDMAGFAAATFMRGVNFVQCPTTILAMVDASVGGKTGVDLPQGKNLIGAFKQPSAVIADLDTLTTLPPIELSAGMAEIVKAGLIASPELLDGLNLLFDNRSVDEKNRSDRGDNRPFSPPLNWSDARSKLAVSDLQPLIVEAILIKRDIVEFDPFESGKRMVLNLGHTFAHAIEQVSGYRIFHGQAVAMGLVAATKLSTTLGHCNPGLQPEIESLLLKLGLPIRIPADLAPHDLIMAMGKDKKKTKNKLQFVLIREKGKVFLSDQVPKTILVKAIENLQ